MTNLIKSKVRISIMLEIIQQIKTTVPKMMRIWRNSATMKQGGGGLFSLVLEWERGLREKAARRIVENVPQN